MKRPFIEAFDDSNFLDNENKDQSNEFDEFSDHDEGDTLEWVKENSTKIITSTASVFFTGVQYVFERVNQYFTNNNQQQQQQEEEEGESFEEKIDNDISIQGYRVLNNRPENQFLPQPIYDTTPVPVRTNNNPMGLTNSKNAPPAAASDGVDEITMKRQTSNNNKANLLKAATMNNSNSKTPKTVKTSGGLFTPQQNGSTPMELDTPNRKLTPLARNKSINFSPDVTPGFKKVLDNNGAVNGSSYGTSFIFGSRNSSSSSSNKKRIVSDVDSSWARGLRDAYMGTYKPPSDDIVEVKYDLLSPGTRTPFARLRNQSGGIIYQALQEERLRKEREQEQQARLKSQQWNENDFPSELKLRERRKLYDALVERHQKVKKEVDSMRLKPKTGKVKDKPFKPLSREREDEIRQIWKERGNRTLVSAFKIDITNHDVRTLSNGQWLNDNIIDYYLSLVSGRNSNDSSCFCFSTHFFTTLQGPRGYSGVARWAKKKKIDVTKLDYIFVPINRNNTHWCLAVINNKEKKFQFFDSMGGYGTPALKVLQEYMISETDRLIPNKVEEHKKKYHEYEICDKLQCPQQSNGSDCGVFTCKMVEVLSREKEFAFGQKDMLGIRLKMTHEILTKRIES